MFQYLTDKKKKLKLSPKIIFKLATNLISALVQTQFFGADNIIQEERNKFHGPPLVGRKLIAISSRLDLKTFINISKASNCTVNDVFMSCITGAVKSMDPSCSNPVICFMFGRFPPGTFATQNTITIGVFRTDLTHESEVLRLQQISKNITCLKSSGLPLGMLFILFVIGNFLPEFLVHRESNIVPATFGGSCVRGPDCEYSTVGDYVTDLSFTAINVGCLGKN